MNLLPAPDLLPSYALALVQVLVPLRALVAVLLGALIYWLTPHPMRRWALLAVSVAVILLGYERPVLLAAAVVAVGGLVFWAVRRGVPRPYTVGGLTVLYAVLHGLFGLLMFTPWLSWTGLSPAFVLPTIGLTTAFTFLRLVHFAVDFTASTQPAPRPLTFLAWCLFFPTFVHLPLIRYGAWADQFERLPCAPSWAQMRHGALRIGQALFKGALVGVVYVALNPAGVLLNPVGANAGQLFAAAVVLAITYYVGFSGYVDLGIGAARLYGIVLPENFAPAMKMARVARMRDFWRNWNISVTQWLRDYVFEPLGGHRRHPVRNVMLTMIACGLWHSVSLYGLLWGFGLGLLLVMEHFWNRLRLRRGLPELPAPARTALLLCALAGVNLALTPYGYDPQWGRYLYPLFWLGITV
ncbi:MAG: MBOAT family O-acyltransferase [Anaerolineae bacterium]|nr:hypothetical protein [Thermoflexales bacterium]MDW8395847.1 MBOAT family O-acyltransferase [Anaerolineae bacterium]